MTWVAGSAATCWRRRGSKGVVAPYPEPTVIHAGPAPRNGQAVQGGRTGVAQRERRVARMQENDGHALQRRTAFGGSLVPRARSAEDSASQTAPAAGTDAVGDLVPGHAGATGQGVVEHDREAGILSHALVRSASGRK